MSSEIVCSVSSLWTESVYCQALRRAQEAQSLQELIDEYNVNVPAYKRIYSLKVRESEFEKTASRKIKRS